MSWGMVIDLVKWRPLPCLRRCLQISSNEDLREEVFSTEEFGCVPEFKP